MGHTTGIDDTTLQTGGRTVAALKWIVERAGTKFHKPKIELGK